MQARKQIADLESRGGGGRGGYEDRMDLIDVKSMQPQVFSGKVQESYKPINNLPKRSNRFVPQYDLDSAKPSTGLKPKSPRSTTTR